MPNAGFSDFNSLNNEFLMLIHILTKVGDLEISVATSAILSKTGKTFHRDLGL